MSRIIACVLALTLVFGMAACTTEDTTGTDGAQPTVTPQEQTIGDVEDDATEAQSGSNEQVDETEETIESLEDDE